MINDLMDDVRWYVAQTNRHGYVDPAAHVSTEVARTVSCPMCGAWSGSRCTYILPKKFRHLPPTTSPIFESAIRHYPLRTRERIRMSGRCMDRAHVARCNVVRKLRNAQHQRDAELRLKTWLITHGDIFVEATQ